MIMSRSTLQSKSFDNLLRDLLQHKQERHVASPLEMGSLRAGARFQGTQSAEFMPGNDYYTQSSVYSNNIDQQHRAYTVRVTLQHVDLAQDYLCGYLTIDDLTEAYPQLTTFFDGDIVSGVAGCHSFATHRWGANESIDAEHWCKFQPFKDAMEREECLGVRSMDKALRLKEEAVKEDSARFVFMRWKEQFLVPDHTVTSVQGATYDGFYYVMYDALNDVLDGYYFHDSSQRNQHLQLKAIGRNRSGSFDFN